MILELCVTELEDVASDTESGRNAAQPVVQESPHPYTDDTSLSGTRADPGRRGTQGGVRSAVLHGEETRPSYHHGTGREGPCPLDLVNNKC